MMQIESQIQYLDWDSNFFALRIARLNENRLTADLVLGIDDWCRANRIDCLYFLADPADSASIRLAESYNFHLVDLRVTFDLTITPTDSLWQQTEQSIRLASPEDIPRLRAIASIGHRDSRFYHDGRFPLECCNELYATWIEKSCTGYADAVLVVDLGEGAVGYLSCHIRNARTGQIGLVGVNEDCQGLGLGRRLLQESLRWFASAGMNHIEVVTQGGNVRASRFYQKGGFLTRSMGLWYHRWFSTSD